MILQWKPKKSINTSFKPVNNLFSVLALPEVGTYVYSRVSRDAPLYEKGIVVEKKKDLICIKHLNGRKLAHEKQNINFVVRNIIPLMSSLKVGLDVIAQPDNDDQKMYLAVIKEVTNKEGMVSLS